MDLSQRLKVLLLENGLRKKVPGIMIEVDRSSKVETRLASIARKRGMLLMIVASCRTRIRWLQIIKESNRLTQAKLVL